MSGIKYIWDLNTDEKRRDEIIFGIYNPNAYRYGGTKHFSGLTYDKLEQLWKENFLNPDDCQNCAPSIAEIMTFMKTNEGFTAHGYTVSKARNDYRISLEGIEKQGKITRKDYEAFYEMFGYADEVSASDGSLYCWFD